MERSKPSVFRFRLPRKIAESMPTMLRPLLRALPCRPSELPHFRAAAVSLYRDSSRPEVVRELSFYFESLRKQKELNDRFFPQSELTQSERMAKLANVVGLEMPESSKD